MNFFKKIWKAIAHLPSYRDFSRERFGRSFIYLFLFSTLFWLISFWGIARDINTAIDHLNEEVIRNVPDFTLEQGLLHVEADMPIILFKDVSSVVILDTTGQTGLEALEPYHSGALILESKVISKQDPYRVEEISFDLFRNMVLTKEAVVAWIPYLKWVNAAIGGFYYFYFMAAHIINALWIALIGWIIHLTMKVKLPFDTVYKLAIYALTLPIILDVLLPYIGIQLYGLFYYLIATVYVALALFEVTKEQASEDFS